MAINAALGIVINHDRTMSFTVFQFTAFALSPAPVPMIDELTIWEVLTGLPRELAVMMTSAADICALNDSIGFNL